MQRSGRNGGRHGVGVKANDLAVHTIKNINPDFGRYFALVVFPLFLLILYYYYFNALSKRQMMCVLFASLLRFQSVHTTSKRDTFDPS
jgi:hypothetical protein